MSSLREYRSRLNLTQRELAEKLGVESNTYARWERGTETPPEMAVRFVAILAEQDSVSSSLVGSAAVSKDPHHAAILEGLNRHLDPIVFEECAVDLLRSVFPGIAPVSGGSDMGFDGAIPTPSGDPLPLIVTTGTDARRNLQKNLGQLKKLERPPEAVVFATSRRLRPKTRIELFDLAAGLGFRLRQVFDQTWFANALYRDAEGTQKLLNISGQPSALTAVPLSSRPVIGDVVIGRDDELACLRQLTGDALVVGVPGSGKTFLLRALVNEGRALFLADANRQALANAVRAQQPEAVIVDDAHAYPSHLKSLLQMRNQTSAYFRIIAVSWPADEDQIRLDLPVDKENVIRLERLPADTIIEIIKSTGITGPNELLRVIREQSAGQPGLAVTLAHLCSKDDIETLRDVVTGEALLKSLLPQLTSLVGDNIVGVLGAFALGGEHGHLQDTVAGFLEIPKYKLSQRLAGLGAAGILYQFRDGSVAIQPSLLAPALVHKAFFGGVGSLPSYLALFDKAPSQSDALKVLIDAHARGADIPELERLLEAYASPEQLGHYARIGSGEARYVLEQYPDRLVGTAFGVLEHLPDRAIPLLLSHALSDAPRRDLSREEQEDYDAQLAYWERQGSRDDALLRRLEDNSTLPLQKLEGWLDRPVPGDQEFGTRRRIAIRSIKSWAESVGLEEPRVATVVSRALTVAFRSMWHSRERDPGIGDRFALQDCPVDEETTQFLFQEWPHVAELICTATDRSQCWPDLFTLQDEWRHEPPRTYVPEEPRALRRAFADRILQTIATASQDHPGIQNRVAKVASQEGVIIETHPDPHFDALYPHEEDRSWDDIEALAKKTIPPLANGYLAAGAKHAAGRLKDIEAEARLVHLGWPRLTPVLCQELAKAVDDPLAWATAFLDAGCPADLVDPFVEKTRGENRTRALDLLRNSTSNFEYRHLFVRIVVTTHGASKGLIATALSMASEWSQFLQGFAWDEVPLPTLKQLCACKHPNVAVTTAIGIWNSEQRDRLIRALGQDWERALIVGLCHKTVDEIMAYWLKDILTLRPGLAEKCLRVLLETDEEAVLPSAAIKVARKAISGLTAQQKRGLIDHATGKAFNAGDLITALVEDDPDAYAHLLATEHLKKFHLEPLRVLPQTHWAEFVVLAADTGCTTDEIIQASAPRGWFWQGPVSIMWRSRQEAYEQFVDHADPRVAEVARCSSDKMRKRAEHEERREQEEKIWGI